MIKTLLAIGGGEEAFLGLKVAKDMGLKLIVADGNPKAVGFSLADVCFHVSTYDADQLKRLSLDYVSSGGAIDGVIAMCADVPVSVSAVAESLGLPSLTMETAQLVSDKLLMKDRLQRCRVNIPRYSSISSAYDLEAFGQEIGFPIVCKPVDSRGARGVVFVEKREECEWAFSYSQPFSSSGRVMAEEYLPGQQISTEAIVYDGEVFNLAFSDRNYANLSLTKPYFIEDGGDYPSSLSGADQEKIVVEFGRAIKALGITNGVAKGDMVLTPYGAKVIEVAGRLSGGYLSTFQIPYSLGVNIVEQAIKISISEKIDTTELIPKTSKPFAVRFINVPEGKISNIKGMGEVEKDRSFVFKKLYMSEGDEASALTDHTCRFGFVMAAGKDKADAIFNAQRLIDTVMVECV